MSEYIECAEGQEQGPAIEDVEPYCVPADEANPGDPVITLPVEPPDYVDPFPPALPLDPVPEQHTHVEVPVQRELAETGPFDPLTILLVGGIVLLAGVATWLTRTKEKED